MTPADLNWAVFLMEACFSRGASCFLSLCEAPASGDYQVLPEEECQIRRIHHTLMC